MLLEQLKVCCLQFNFLNSPAQFHIGQLRVCAQTAAKSNATQRTNKWSYFVRSRSNASKNHICPQAQCLFYIRLLVPWAMRTKQVHFGSAPPTRTRNQDNNSSAEISIFAVIIPNGECVCVCLCFEPNWSLLSRNERDGSLDLSLQNNFH